jgi:hypothetical protein
MMARHPNDQTDRRVGGERGRDQARELRERALEATQSEVQRSRLSERG